MARLERASNLKIRWMRMFWGQRKGGGGRWRSNLPPGKDPSGNRVQTLRAQKEGLSAPKGRRTKTFVLLAATSDEVPLASGTYRRRKKAGMSKFSLSKVGIGNSLILELSVTGSRIFAPSKPVAMTVI